MASSTSPQLVRFLNKNIKISPRKLRLLANEVKKYSPLDALNRLKFVNAKSARVLTKAIQNVLASALHNYSLDQNSLKFDTIRVDESLKIKRMDKSHGSRFARGLIQKRHSRLTIILAGPAPQTQAPAAEVKAETKKAVAPKKPAVKKT